MATELMKMRYDVFLCYEGEDTRSFTEYLYYVLRDKRFITFMSTGGSKSYENDEGEISSSVLKALEESRISIVILSYNFASSASCLNELVKIIECKKMKNQLVLTIFFAIDPSNVKRLRGTFGKTLENLEDRFIEYKQEEEVRKWRPALLEVAKSPAIHFKWFHHDFQLTEGIVKWITKHLIRYDVYLSFSEKDTRYSFTGFLSDALQGEGFNTILKDEGSEKEDQISQSLVTSIENSRLLILVLSDNYAYSSSCLDELVMIIDLMKKQNRQIWPVFYNVEPSDVRHQRNHYGKAMIQHESKFGINSEKVRNWRSALLQVANLKGWHMKTRYDYQVIEKIVAAAIKLYSRVN